MLAQGFFLCHVINFDETNTVLLLCTLAILLQEFIDLSIITDDVDDKNC